jgi:hypothetical protein
MNVNLAAAEIHLEAAEAPEAAAEAAITTTLEKNQEAEKTLMV